MLYLFKKEFLMKSLKHILIGIFLSQAIVFANYNDIYIADIQYDWIKKTEVEKEAIISEIHDIIFEKGEITDQKELKLIDLLYCSFF